VLVHIPSYLVTVIYSNLLNEKWYVKPWHHQRDFGHWKPVLTSSDCFLTQFNMSGSGIDFRLMDDDRWYNRSNATSYHYNKLIALYISPGTRLLMSILVVVVDIVIIDAIKRAHKRYHNSMDSIEFFFVQSLLASGIIATIVHNFVVVGIVINTHIHPDTRGIPCAYVGCSYSTHCANSIFVTIVCIDRMLYFSPHTRQKYIKIMTWKIRNLVVFSVWLLSLFGCVLMPLDPELSIKTNTGVCAHRAFINSIGIIMIFIPSILSALVATVANVYVYCLAHNSAMIQLRQMRPSGSITQSNNNPEANDTRRNTITGQVDQNRRRSQIARRGSQFVRRGSQMVRQSSRQLVHRGSMFFMAISNARKSALTCLILAGSHIIMSGILPLLEFMLLPRYEGLAYDIPKYIVFVLLSFTNLLFHPLLYGFYFERIRRNIWKYDEIVLCCCAASSNREQSTSPI